MKRILFSALAVISFASVATAQSNKKGTINFGLNGGVVIGSTKDDNTSNATVGVTYGVWGQYGLTDNLSAGINVGYGAYGTTVSTDGGSFGSNDVTSTLGGVYFSAEGRYYFVNKDRFNFFAYPSVGYTSQKDITTSIGVTDNDFKISGLTYGVGVGINWYFTDFFGGNVKLGYEGNSLSGDNNAKANFGGVAIQGGLSFKLN